MDVIGDYEYSKKDLIGHGAFAVVFKGRRRDNASRTVAIKSITKKNLAKSQNLLSKEIKILKELSSLHHENVVHLMDCKETSHHVYLVMEYCNGGDLADYLHAKGTLSEDTIVIFLKQIAGAMLALNAKGVVHRDLKPQNLLLCHSGKQNPPPSEIMVKIADFGFARFLNDGVMAATLCGSPMYMAPEVIMSLQYDAKADLWSIGTIVFQCLTGKAPFQAQTPQQLKQFYEKHLDLKPSIPSGTSPELKDLLYALLKRNAKDRIDFEAFHNHPFLNPKSREKKTAPVPVPNRRRASCSSASDSPSVKTVTASPLSGYMPATPPERRVNVISRHDSPENVGFIKVNREASSPVEDFVMVPEHLPGDFSDNEFYSPRPNSRASTCSDRSDARSHEAMSTRQSGYDNSPGRPSSLLVPSPSPGSSPISEPIPVPTQVQAYHQLQRNSPSSPYCRSDHNHSHYSAQGSDMSLQRSDEVQMQRKSSYGSAADIGSLSPPSVQFVIGTPPNVPNPWRRSSISGGTPPLNRHPPPITNSPHRLFDEPDTCSFLPTRGKRSMTEPTELHRYGGSSPGPGLDREQLLRVAFGGPGTSPPTFYGRSPTYGYASTRKERNRRRSSPGVSPGLDNYARSPPTFDQAAMFIPPELAEETLMDREHNETMSKLNFVLALVECIMELAQARNTPLTESMHQNNKLDTFTLDRISFISEGQRRLEQLVLYVRALQMLSSSMHLAKSEIAAGRLQPSSTLKASLKSMNKHYHHCLKVCKNLQSKGQVPNLNLAQNSGVTAEKLIYSYAIEMCQTAALDELFGNPGECFRRYQQAQILLHSLSQQALNNNDRHLLDKYKNSVIKRLYNLQNQGFIYSVESSN